MIKCFKHFKWKGKFDKKYTEINLAWQILEEESLLPR